MDSIDRILHDEALLRGQNPNDPAVIAALRQEYEAKHANDEKETVLTVPQLRELAVRCIQMLNGIEDHIIKPERLANSSLADIFVDQALDFTENIIAADGVIKDGEADFICGVFGLRATPQELAQDFRDKRQRRMGLDASMMSYYTPAAYSAALAADLALSPDSPNRSAWILTFYKELAKSALMADGSITEEEQGPIKMFLLSLKSQTGTDGFIYADNSGGVRI